MNEALAFVIGLAFSVLLYLLIFGLVESSEVSVANFKTFEYLAEQAASTDNEHLDELVKKYTSDNHVTNREFQKFVSEFGQSLTFQKKDQE